MLLTSVATERKEHYTHELPEPIMAIAVLLIQKQKNKTNNTVAATIIGGAIGSVFGPVGTFVGAGISAAIGNNSSPKK